ncbi:MAG: exo-alpha-sialidase [Promethearchaeota archaeon]
MFEKEDLFPPREYFAQCHSAHLAEIPDPGPSRRGSTRPELWVTFFAGTAEKARDVGSWVVKRPVAASATASWSRPEKFHKVPGKSTGTAHLFVAGPREVWMLYNLMNWTGWSTCSILKRVSRDGGRTWGKPEYIRRVWGWVTSGKILVLDNGDYLMPIHREFLKYQGHVLISTDRGGRWRRCGRMKTPNGALEPSVVQLRDKSLLCHLRTKDHQIYETRSFDRGRTWTRPESTGLPNPDSMVTLLALPSGTVVLAYNHSYLHRSPLVLRHSTDGGRTWVNPKVLERGNREYSYPNMLLASDGFVHLVYTNGRETITHAAFDETWLRG